MTTYSQLTTQKEKIAFLKEKLATNTKWAVKGMLRIYEFQTQDEKEIGTTVQHNNVGYSGAHAEIMSSFSVQVIKGRSLSPKQIQIVHRIMPKYARQLMRIADGTN